MTIQLALSEEDNDLILLDGGGVARVQDGRYTIQLVKNKLLTLLGEWRLDPSIGWLNYNDYVRNPDLFDYEMRARESILSASGVQEVSSISLRLESRVLYLSFTAKTIYGEISLTIPWSV